MMDNVAEFIKSKSPEDLRDAGMSEQVQKVPEEWPDIIPLSAYSVPVFPVDCLPDWQQEYVMSLATATQTPTDLSSMLSMSVIAAAIAKKIVVIPREGWKEPANIYSVIVLPPASRKSAVHAECILPILEYEKTLRDSKKTEVRAAQNEYKALEQALQQAQGKKAKALADGKTLEHDAIYELSEKLENFDMSVMPKLVIDDATVEAIPAIMAEQGGRLAVLSAEGDLFDIAAGRYSNSNSVNIGIFLKGHSGDMVRVDRIGRGSVTIDSPALTIGLAVQPDVLRGLVQRQGFRGRGLLGRFLYSLPVDNIGHRKIDVKPLPEVIQQRYCQKIYALLDLTLSTTSRALLLDDAAKVEFMTFLQWLENNLADGGELASIPDWGGKLGGAVARIAGILHMAEYAGNSEPWGRKITADTIGKAVKIGKYLKEHAKAAFDIMGGNEDIEAAKGILQYVEIKGLNVVSKRDLFRYLQGRFNKADDMMLALTILQERGYLRPKQSEREIKTAGRKPSIQYEFNPAIWDRNVIDKIDTIDKMPINFNNVNSVNNVNGVSDINLLEGEF